MEDAPGASGKNLFLRDKKKKGSGGWGGRYILLMTLMEKRVDLKRWSKQESLGKMSFADAQFQPKTSCESGQWCHDLDLPQLANTLGVNSGAVGPLALINDLQHSIEVFIDCNLWEQGYVHCHPLVNTASLVLKVEALEDFFLMTGHSFRLVNVPSVT